MNNTTTQTNIVSPSYTGNDYLDNFLNAEIDLLALVPVPKLVSTLDQGLRAILYTQLELIRLDQTISASSKQRVISIVQEYLDGRGH